MLTTGTLIALRLRATYAAFVSTVRPLRTSLPTLMMLAFLICARSDIRSHFNHCLHRPVPVTGDHLKGILHIVESEAVRDHEIDVHPAGRDQVHGRLRTAILTAHVDNRY